MSIRMVPLGELVEAAPIERAENAELPVLSMTRANGLVPQESVFKKRIASRDLTKYKVVRPGQLVVGIHIDEGAIGVSKPADHGIVSPAYAIWDLPGQSRVDAAYLDRFIRSPRAIAYFVAHYRKTADRRGKLTRERFLGLEVPLPPIEEQRRIAAVLDAADALRAKRRQALAKLDTLTPAVFIDMFGDGKRNQKRWPVAPIGSLIRDARGGASLKPDDFASTGFPVLHKGAIKPGGVVELDAGKKTYAHPDYAASRSGSVVTREFTVVTLRDLVPTGPSIGLAAHLRGAPYSEYLLAQGAYGFRLDVARMTPEYFVALSNDVGFRTVFKRLSVGSTQIHIRNPVYQQIEVPVPPIELQRRFAAIVESVEPKAASHRAHLDELDTLFASLQQRAFRGDL